MRYFSSLILVGIALVSTAVSAQTVGQRQDRQQNRINQGLQSGELTGREAAKLQRGQDNVQRKKDNARADGVVTRAERRDLNRAQNRQNQRIHNQKHDRQKQ